MAVHILGNSTNMIELNKIIKGKIFILLKIHVNHLGQVTKKKLGTFGDFGTFSFYYSHQITSGEGGMIVCNDKKNYEIIHSLRAHGWDRGLNNKNQKSFNFINSGFNLRPTETSAAIGYSQLKKLSKFKKTRSSNRNKIIKKLQSSKKWREQFTFIYPAKNLDPSWFGLPILINKPYIKKKRSFLII